MAGEKPHTFTAEGAHKLVDAERRLAALEINLRALQRIVAVHQAPILQTIAFPLQNIAPDDTDGTKFGKGLPGAEVQNDDSVEIEATNSTGSTVWTGSKCILSWLMVDQSAGSGWHIVQSNSARTVKATVNEASGVATSDATYDVDAVTVQSGSYFSPTTITGVKNTHSWAMDDNAVVQLVYNETLQAWDTVNVNCPA